MVQEGVHSPCISDYELSREDRIRENRERMRKLGIFDLSDKVKSSLHRASRRKIVPGEGRSPLPKPGPARRSSRLQNSTPVSYCESVVKRDKSLYDDDLLREVGSKPEIYTEEHEKLLGGTERSWTLFVDGCGKDGKRIYDPVRGKTCHQCRQKTLGHRTNCSKCHMFRGQFCGDCLYMRYGENVLEANENPNWICPVCRGICNCSFCRQAKGWPPTGTLFRKISSLGYKSVAHYLIKTRRVNADSEGTKVPMSSRRSLPFSDAKTMMGENDLSQSSVVSVNIDPPSEMDKDGKITSESNSESSLESVTTPQSKMHVEHLINSKPKRHDLEYGMEKEAKDLLPGGVDENRQEPNMARESQRDQILPTSSNCHGGLLTTKTLERGTDNEIKRGENVNMNNADVGVLETSPKSTKKHVHSQPTHDSIAQRLKQKRNHPNTGEKLDVAVLERNLKSTKKPVHAQPTPDNIGQRLKQRRNSPNTGEKLDLVNVKIVKRRAKDTSKIADGDSIASRLKRRRS